LTTVGKAARMYAANSPLKLENIEYPTPASDQVLVKIKASGICFSDVHALKGELPPSSLPLVLGHEGAGIVEATGTLVKEFRKGQPVVVDYVHSCGKCAYCKSGRNNLCSNVKLFGFDVDGSFAEYAIVNARNLVPIPEQIPYDQGAILGCAVSTPYHAIRIAGLKKDQTAAILGIGGVGYHAALLCKSMGTQLIAIDISQESLQNAERAGAKLTVNSKTVDPVETVKAFTDQEGVDVALDFVGNPKTVATALAILKKGGVAVVVGITPGKLELDSLSLLLREVQLRTSIDHTRDDLLAVIHLVEEGKLDLSHSITHRIGLSEINEGFRILEKKIPTPIRVVVAQ